VSDYCALTEVFLLPRIQLCSLRRLNWLLLPYDYRHDYFLFSRMLKLSFLKPSKSTHWIFASKGPFFYNKQQMNRTVAGKLSTPRHTLQSLFLARDKEKVIDS